MIHGLSLSICRSSEIITIIVNILVIIIVVYYIYIHMYMHVCRHAGTRTWVRLGIHAEANVRKFAKKARQGSRPKTARRQKSFWSVALVCVTWGSPLFGVSSE